MSLIEDRWKSLLFQEPEHMPVSVSILPAAWKKHREQLQTIVRGHPILFGTPEGNMDYDAVGQKHRLGGYTDAWGCVWDNIHEGMAAIVTGHPLPKREDVRTLEAPREDIGFPHGFMFLRLTDLRGFAEMMLDFAEEPPELRQLVDIVLDYNLRQGRLRLAQLPDEPRIVYFGDDLGLQKALPISPDMWRRYLKPCYEAIYRPFIEAGHAIYMHTDGHILEIMADLIDCGVKVVNPQVRANGLDGLRRFAKGRIAICLDLDRQLFPFAAPSEIKDHIHECVQVLGDPAGGLWLSAEIGPDVPLENVETICATLEAVR